MSDIAPYRLFNAVLARKQALSPALCRITFKGEEVRAMATRAPDQRIKIFFPDRAGQPPALPLEGWQAAYQAMSPAARPPRRTYTIRHLRADAGEVDVDFVLHGATGPASAWAMSALPGAPVQIIAPNAAHQGDMRGYEWRPPADVRHVLLIADETALPAVAGILEELAQSPKPPATQVFLEVPSAADRIDLPDWPGLRLTWLPREGGESEGTLIAAAAARALVPTLGAANDDALAEVDIDREILWELGEDAGGGFYGWVAGESEAVMTIRRLLIKERGVDRRAMTLMGYWRRGRALDDAA